jgi:hypothetical protein
VRKFLEAYKEVLDLVDKAARRERCTGDGKPATKLPDPDYLWEFGNLVAVRARLQIADGDVKAALHTLQTGFALAKHESQLPKLRDSFFVDDFTSAILRQLDYFVQEPKAPNLYWALTDLPRPLIDMRKVVERDRLALYRKFPGITEAAADPNAGLMTEKQVQDCVAVLIRYVPQRTPPVVLYFTEFDFRRTELSRRLTEHYEEHKKVLLDQGRPKEKVEAMPHVQVALLAELHRYDQALDNQMKWYNEPYFKVADRVEAMAKALREKPPGQGILPDRIFDVLDVYRARVGVERRINALRCLEAIRAYAAAHAGKLPASLDDVKDVPIPLDPVTGKAFVYKVADGKATLESPEVAGEDHLSFDDLAYEITIKRP